MAHAICESCGHEQAWRAQRGTKLADIPCQKCGGVLKGLTAGREGKHYCFATCEYCGKRKALKNLVRLTQPAKMLMGVLPLPVGTVLCRWHDTWLDSRYVPVSRFGEPVQVKEKGG